MAQRIRPLVPGPVLAQVWRGGRGRDTLLARYLRDCDIYIAYSEEHYRRAGVMLGKASLPNKTRPGVIDALVALTGVERSPAPILTSDASDIAACLDTLPESRTVIVSV